jgi:hypothetical protein
MAVLIEADSTFEAEMVSTSASHVIAARNSLNNHFTSGASSAIHLNNVLEEIGVEFLAIEPEMRLVKASQAIILVTIGALKLGLISIQISFPHEEPAIRGLAEDQVVHIILQKVLILKFFEFSVHGIIDNVFDVVDGVDDDVTLFNRAAKREILLFDIDLQVLLPASLAVDMLAVVQGDIIVKILLIANITGDLLGREGREQVAIFLGLALFKNSDRSNVVDVHVVIDLHLAFHTRAVDRVHVVSNDVLLKLFNPAGFAYIVATIGHFDVLLRDILADNTNEFGNFHSLLLLVRLVVLNERADKVGRHKDTFGFDLGGNGSRGFLLHKRLKKRREGSRCCL